ncbi:hypothetical protein BGW80DRAFT_1446720 [Lactifluus volemus]|nr:hypothetical protein BGW80DRAFT_1446720 [Lactifluus volemus]
MLRNRLWVGSMQHHPARTSPTGRHAHLRGPLRVSILSLITLIVVLRQRQNCESDRSSPPAAPLESFTDQNDGDPNKDRRPGDWTPVKSPFPPVTPITESLDQIAPRPYRPYKPGRYHVTMGIHPMVWNSWIELDRDFPAYYHLRAARLASPRGPKLIYTLPDRPHLVRGGAQAARELVHELAEFLVGRYLGRDRCGRGTPVGVTHDLGVEDPMMVAAMLTQDDLAIMIEGSDGQYYLQLVLSSWLARGVSKTKLACRSTRYIRAAMYHIHACSTKQLADPGPPTHARACTWPQSSDAREPLEELAWAEGTFGPEDTLGTCPRPAPPEPLPERMRLRVEHQTLRRLPRSGAIVFTIRVYMTPLEELEPGEAGRLAAAVRA